MNQFLTRHAYGFLMAAGLLDVATTWYMVTAGGGWELNPLMAFAFINIGILPTMLVKLALTSEFGLSALHFESRAIYYVAVTFTLVGLWNLGWAIISLIT